ncbi:MAG: exodeoxyribonuclease VII large subunit [Planctomycetes bacterium]|nr:exodeoxyribonuclease VII large subunit [Planctomycetota bacterium]
MRRAASEAVTVGELTRRIKSLLEGSVGTVAVTGELSGLKISPSGHVYFALKDASALLDCVLWRSAAVRLPDLPRDGTMVTVRGKISVYEPRGRYQLVATTITAGTDKGDLWRRFEATRDRLLAEGLFAPERKRSLPAQPRCIGIVTSPAGAALRDMLTIIGRRSPQCRVVVSPALVQGREAAADIVQAIRRLEQWGCADVIVVCRGGGSLEDLWPFNEEAVARAIAAAAIPIVSAVGHETDVTIADFAADARAATPSEAAERIVPDHSHLRGRMAHTAVVLSRALAGAARERREALRGVARNPMFRRPQDLFLTRWQRLDDAMERLSTGVAAGIDRAAGRMRLAEASLGGLSPLRVLERGYAVVQGPDGRAVLDAGDLAPGDAVTAILHRGRIEAEVRRRVPADAPTAAGRPEG